MFYSLLIKAVHHANITLVVKVLLLFLFSNASAQPPCDCPPAPRNSNYNRSFINAQKSIAKHSIEASTSIKAIIPMDVVPIPIEGTGVFNQDEANNTEHTETESIQIIERELSQLPAQIMAEASAALCRISCNNGGGNDGPSFKAWQAIDALTQISERALGYSSSMRTPNTYDYVVNNRTNYIYVNPCQKAAHKKMDVFIANNSMGEAKFRTDLPPGVRKSRKFTLRDQMQTASYIIKIPANVTNPIERKVTIYPINQRSDRTEVKFVIMPLYGPYPETDAGEVNPNAFIDPKSVGGVPTGNQLFHSMTWDNNIAKRSFHASEGREQYYPSDGTTLRAKANAELFYTKRENNNSMIHTLEFSNRLHSQLLVQNPSEILATLAPVYKTTVYISPNTIWEGRISFQPSFDPRISIDPAGQPNFTVSYFQVSDTLKTITFVKEDGQFVRRTSEPIILAGGSTGNRYTITVECPSMQLLRGNESPGPSLDRYGNAVFTFIYSKKVDCER